MTFSLALPKSSESLAFLAGLEGDSARKGAASDAGEGFADLLAQLASLTPGALSKTDAEGISSAERQEIDLPTGKSLPLAAFVLPDMEFGLTEAEIGEGVEGAEILAAMIAHPSGTMAALDKAAALAAEASQGPKITAAGQALTSGLAGAATEGSGTGEARPAQSGQGFDVRIAAAQQAGEAKLPDMATKVESGKAQGELAQTGAAASGAALEGRAADSAKAAGIAASPEAGPGSDRAARKRDAAVKADLATTRTADAIDAPKAMPQALAGRLENSGVAGLAHGATVRPVVTDPFAQVERVVDHLTAARQVDLSKPTAIAVAHKEFGALTVTFDTSATGMNVEIAAEDSEAHRALAAAMASDRGASRQQDGASSGLSTSQHNSQPGAERGGASNHAGTGFGQGSTDGQRSQQTDQRGRRGDGAAPQPQPGPQSNSDDALYA